MLRLGKLERSTGQHEAGGESGKLGGFSREKKAQKNGNKQKSSISIQRAERAICDEKEAWPFHQLLSTNSQYNYYTS
jgi:hypothetical protein